MTSADISSGSSQSLSRAEQIDHIRTISEAMVRVSESALDAPVEHCPGWNVRDLVAHIADVQWFWADIIERGVTRYDGSAPVATPTRRRRAGRGRRRRRRPVLNRRGPATPARECAVSWEDEIEELHHRRALAAEMGGPERVARQRAAGKLTIRDRVKAIGDERPHAVATLTVALPRGGTVVSPE